ncbi:MAG: energy-coupling factor transporter ATPase [Eubacteriales bacterium]|nr:energy-coupling factor transporter ATPase [Eubacteriales bacterium]
MIELNQVSFAYQTGEAGETQVLCDVNFQAFPGECVVLCGKSGCGKTTLLRLVNGLVPHFYVGKLEGSALVGGLNVQQTPLSRMARVVGSVFQNPRAQFFHLDTTGEMAFQLENQNMPRAQMQERLEEVAHRLNLQELMDRNIFELSGGEKQQIACGSVYASLPQIIVMDEPSSNLDMESIRKLQKLIRIMKEEGKTILISEHRLWYLEGIADRYVLLENGRISREFTPEAAAALSRAQRRELGLRAIRRKQLYETQPRELWSEQKDAGLEIAGLQFSRQMRQVLDVPRLRIPKGAIVAVIGENGAGKSTLSLCLAGLLKHSGTIWIEGEKIASKKLPGQAYLVMQEAGHQLFSDTVLGELTLNNETLTEKQAGATLDKLGLSGMENRHPGSLSGGQQQRVSLGTALCTKRKLMLYDEPTSGQDGENLLRTAELIRAANEQAACTLIVTHDPELILRCATHILHIHAGEVKKFMPCDERGVCYMKKVFEEDAQTKKPRKTGIPRLLEFAGQYRPLLGAAKFLAGVSALFLLGPFVCVYFAACELLNGLTGSGFDVASLVQWGVWALVLELAGLAFDYAALLCSHTVAFHTEKNLKMAALRHLSRMPMGYFEENPSGKLRKIIDENSGQVESYLAHQLPDLVSAQVTTAASLILMLAIDWRIGLLLVALLIASFACQMSMMGEKTMNFMKRYQDAQEEMNHEAVEYVRGISVIKVFGQSVHSIRRFREAINAYRDDALAFTMACKPGYVGFNTVVNAAFLVLIPAALIGLRTAGDLTAFTENFLFYLIFAPACASVLNKIMYMSNYKMQAMESMRRIDTVLLAREQSEEQEPQTTQDSDIRFEHVTFTYPTGEEPAISDVSFHAKAGTVTALVGHSGSGKTTIGTLVPRFYDVQEGRITLGGVELSRFSRQELMAKVAFVFQNPKLLKTTLEENIRGGCKGAGRAEILRAAHLAQCDDILEKLPEGIDSMVGGKGVYLSGGEVQRVAIARAILKDAPVIILDEATAFADPENEVQIQAALKELTKGKTVIMIAHRLSTIQDADQILVMKKGRLAEQGTHGELLDKNGEYARIWADYNQAITWKIDQKEEVKPC